MIIKSGCNEMDFDRVTHMLKDAPWCVGIKKNEVIQGAQNSALVVGAFTPDNLQVGFLRVVSDCFPLAPSSCNLQRVPFILT